MAVFTTYNYELLLPNGADYDTQGFGQTASSPITWTETTGDGTFQVGETFTSSLGGTWTFRGHETGSNGVLYHLFDNGTFRLLTPDSSGAPNFPGHPTTITQVNLEILETPTFCFGPDTDIAVPEGTAKVQDLSFGDMISTADGREVAVKWIGRQRLQARHMLAASKEPVRISAGALGDGLPCTDLTVSADHGMVLDGLVVNASALVNGTTIGFVPVAELADGFTYYHIETEAHDVIIANGAASETFIDIPGRKAFDNYAEYLELFGAERIIPEMQLPRIASQRLLPEALRARLGICKVSVEFETVLKSA